MKWMKIGGIIGIILLILLVFSIAYTIVFGFSSDLENEEESSFSEFNNVPQNPLSSFSSSPISNVSPVLILALLAIFIIMACIFLYGCHKLGIAAQSSFLKVSSILLMISIILFVITFSAIAILGKGSNDAHSSDLGLASSSSQIPLIILAALFIFVSITTIIFYTGFIDSYPKVHFAKVSGFFGLFSFGFGFLAIITIIIALPSMILSSLGAPGADSILDKIAISFYALSGLLHLLFILFASLSLFDGSKKYESHLESTALAYIPSSNPQPFYQPAS